MAFQEVNVAVGLKVSCEPAFLMYSIRMHRQNELHILLDDFLQHSFLKDQVFKVHPSRNDPLRNFPDMSKQPVSTEQDVWQGQSYTTGSGKDLTWMQAQSSLKVNDKQKDKLFSMSQHWAGLGYSKFHKYARVQIPAGYNLISVVSYQHTSLNMLLRRWPNCVFARSQWHAVADVQSGIYYMSPDKVFCELGIEMNRLIAVYEFTYAFHVNPQHTWTCCLAFSADIHCPSVVLLHPHPLNGTISQMCIIDFADFWKSTTADPFDPLDTDKVMCVLTPETRKTLAVRENKRTKLNSKSTDDVHDFVSNVLNKEEFDNNMPDDMDAVNRRKRRSRQLLFDQQHYALHAHKYFMPELEKVYYGSQAATAMPMSDDRLMHVLKATMVDKHCTLSNPSQCTVFVSEANAHFKRLSVRMVVSGVDLCNMYILVQQKELRMFLTAEEAEKQFVMDIKHLRSSEIEFKCRWNADRLVGLDDDMDHVTVLFFNGKHICFGAWTLLRNVT